jgi:hypothetical protein
VSWASPELDDDPFWHRPRLSCLSSIYGYAIEIDVLGESPSRTSSARAALRRRRLDDRQPDPASSRNSTSLAIID